MEAMNQKGINGHGELHATIAEMREEMNRHFDAIERLIVKGSLVLFGTMVIGFLGLVLTQH